VGPLTPAAIRRLAARHGIRPRKSLGQHFLIEPSLARRIVELAGVRPGSRVLEVGAGLGSLTISLAEAGADVVALEVDPKLVPALSEAVAPFGNQVRVVMADAMDADWAAILGPEGAEWAMVANLPYNVATPVVIRALESEPRIRRLLVMVQREVGERLAARPGDPQFGGVSLRVAYWAGAKVVRRVPASVFWPRPQVESVLVSLDRHAPPVAADRERLFTVIRVSFAERRKTMRSALIRLGVDRAVAADVLEACGIAPNARPEELGLAEFGCLTERLSEGPA
jgi:16S rRNA (adenine1518-N6/adenine1519-N6)-dimethyltransferase